jgi:L-alanine-DL-glutamate epimerase-like enolase superfamily enzyme
MSLPTDIRPLGATLYFLPVQTRVPLKFGTETLTSVTCARVRLRVRRTDGREAEGWGETPLSVQWAWPSPLAHERRHAALREFCAVLARAWAGFGESGHALEIGHAFLEHELPARLREWNGARPAEEAMPWLAALVCCSAFDIALHDAYGRANDVPVYETYDAPWMSRDLAHFLTPAADRAGEVSFACKWPAGFLRPARSGRLLAWHLVGGLDPLDAAELHGDEPRDGHPVLLADWIRHDGLRALKVKLRGNDDAWDYERLVRVGGLARANDVLWLTADFNCTVTDPAYVCAILDRLRDEEPRIFALLLYVEQPFPYELDAHPIAVHAVASRGRELGWTGVALKTCKTQTGALLSLCWAQAHGMTLMVQDLTNPMLAQIPHCLLAAHAPTIAGVETNAMQFYPEASAPEAVIHPGLYQRRAGFIDLSTVRGPGFGYREGEIARNLPAESV